MPRYWHVLWAATALLGMVATSSAQDPFAITEKPQSDATGTSGASGRSLEKSGDAKASKKEEPKYVRKSLQEWQRTLPPAVFSVTRMKATEPPFSGRYAVGHFEGTFVCACCQAELFSSKAKFDSGTGWPSFWAPVKPTAIARAVDNSEAEPRVEVMCSRCGAHLGHVFDDGYGTPTGLRFCINSLSLKLESKNGESARPSTSRTRSRSRTRTARSRSRLNRPSTTENQEADAPKSGEAKPSAEKPSGSE